MTECVGPRIYTSMFLISSHIDAHIMNFECSALKLTYLLGGISDITSFIIMNHILFIVYETMIFILNIPVIWQMCTKSIYMFLLNEAKEGFFVLNKVK